MLTQQPNWERWLCHIWLPLGLTIQLTGFFWLPSTHSYKVVVTDLLLVPALLSLFSLKPFICFRHSWIFQLALLYIMYMATIPFLNSNPEPEKYVKWSFYILLYLIAVGARADISPQNLRHILLASAITCGLAILYALFRDGIGHQLQLPNYRLTGYAALYNPLMSGHLFGFFFIVALSVALNEIQQSRIHWMALAAALTCLLGIIMSGSRAPLVAVSITTFYIILSQCPTPLRTRILAIFSLFLALIWIIFWDKLSERGLSLRPQIWIEVIRQSLAHPWIGTGLNADLNIQIDDIPDPFVATHNVILTALFYGGAIGVMLLVALQGGAFWLGHRMRHKFTEAALAAELSLYGFITLQFDSGSLISRPTECWLLLWLPVAFAIRTQFLNYRSIDASPGGIPGLTHPQP